MKNLKHLSLIASILVGCSAFGQVGSTFHFVSVGADSFESAENWTENALPKEGADIIITTGSSVYLTGMGTWGSKKPYSYSSIKLDTGATAAFTGKLGGEFGGGWKGANPRINAAFDTTGDFTNVSGANIFTLNGDSNPLEYRINIGGELGIQSGSLKFAGGGTNDSHPFIDSLTSNTLNLSASTTLTAYTSAVDIVTTANIAGATLKLYAVGISTDTSFLNIGSTLTSDTSSKIVIDFERIGNLSAGTYDLITLEKTDSISDIKSIVELKNTDKINATFHWEGNKLYAVAVPEPSVIAVVLGAIALAFAAYRRK